MRTHLAFVVQKWLTADEEQSVIDEIDDIDAKKVERVVFCSGKVYYELLQERRKLEQDNIAIVRVEQIGRAHV